MIWGDPENVFQKLINKYFCNIQNFSSYFINKNFKLHGSAFNWPAEGRRSSGALNKNVFEIFQTPSNFQFYCLVRKKLAGVTPVRENRQNLREIFSTIIQPFFNAKLLERLFSYLFNVTLFIWIEQIFQWSQVRKTTFIIS